MMIMIMKSNLFLENPYCSINRSWIISTGRAITTEEEEKEEEDTSHT